MTDDDEKYLAVWLSPTALDALSELQQVIYGRFYEYDELTVSASLSWNGMTATITPHGTKFVAEEVK